MRKINKHDLLVCGTGNMEGGGSKEKQKHKSAEEDPVLLYSPAVLLEKHHRKQTRQEGGHFPERAPINVLSKKKN